MTAQRISPAQGTHQAFRYTAIVSASAASLTLTIAAGAYVMSQMAPGTSTHSPETALDVPDRSVVDAQPRVARAFAAPTPVSATAAVYTAGGAQAPLPALPAVGATDLPATGPAAAAPPGVSELAQRSEQGRYLDLGVAAVDTRRDEQLTTVTLTVDPRITAALHGLVTDTPTEGRAATTLRTEIDRERGAVAVGFSDPVLGERSVRMPGATPQAQESEAVPV